MICIPSLLFLQCDPQLDRRSASDKKLPGITRFQTNRNGNSTSSSPEAAGIVSDNKNNSEQYTPKRSIIPAAIRLQRIWETEPPQIGGFEMVGANQRAPFWERQQQEEEQQKSPTKKLVVSLRRKSQVFAFLWTLATFVAVDDYALLPVGTLLYAVAITMAWENWTDEAEENRRLMQQINRHKARLKTIQREVDNAKFEYHVLKNKPQVDIVVLHRRATAPKYNGRDMDSNWNADDDDWVIFADEKKHKQ